MSDKMRGAIFGVLGDIKGLKVLDAFSGSGALAIESISRGADSAVAVEVDKAAQTVIASNIEKLGIEDRIKAIRANASAWSNRHPDEKFDVVLCDPPYDDLQYKVLRKIPKHLADDGVFVLSLPGKHEPLTLAGLELVQTKDYGDGQLIFYKR